MAVPFIESAFSAGELSPSLWGRIDLSKFHVGAATLRNAFVDYRGGARSRAGTKFVGRSKQNPALGQMWPKLIPFSFNLPQDFTLEFGDEYIRFITDGGFVTEPAYQIASVVQTRPVGIFTTPAHNFNDGDWVTIANAGGMPLLNGTFIVSAAHSLTGFLRLLNLDGTPVDATLYPPYSGGGLIARIYTIASPYTAAEAWALKFAQSADVMTLTHPNFPPYDLKRFGPVNWTIAPTSFGSGIAAPASCSVVATTNPSGSTTPPTLPTAYAYQVTAVNPANGEESQPSPIGNVTNSVDIAATAGSLVITWAAVPAANSYNIYKAPPSYNTKPGDTSNATPVPAGALFGLCGTAFGTQFVDSNVTTDFTHTPPQHKNPLSPGQVLAITMTSSSGDWTTATITINTTTGSGAVLQAVIVNGQIVAAIVVNPGHDYASADTLSFSGDGSSAGGTLTVGPQTGTFPSLVSYYQQRRIFASSLNQPDTYWMSQPGAFQNFDTSIPVIASDAITGTPFSEKVDGIQWMVEMPLGLITFTGSAIEQIQASGSFALSPAALTPENQQALPQSSIGSSSSLGPVRNNWDLLYFEPDNATLRDLTYQLYFNLYTGVDVTWQSAHLTQGHQVTDRTWCRKPFYLLWMVRDDGVLLSFTFVKEQEVTGWAKHTTMGQVRAVCSITELPVDALYMVVQRYLPSGQAYLIERMDDRLWQSAEDPWCVDCGVATTPTTPPWTLFASAASGNGVTFTASNDSFGVSSVGQTLRMGGGIAVVTAYTNPQNVVGNWLLPCRELIPEGGFPTPLPQPAGAWSISPNVTTVTGLLHLAGAQVVGLADGVPIGPLTVSATGTVTLPFAASDIKLGLGFTAQVQSVYLDTGAQPTVQGRRKAITAVTVRCEASSPMQAGANQIDASAQSPPPLFATWSGLASLPSSPTQLPATYQSPGGQTVQPPFTGDLRIPIPSDWKRPGQVAVQQLGPQPLNLLALIPEGLEGDTPEQTYTPRQQPQRRGAASLLPA